MLSTTRNYSSFTSPFSPPLLTHETKLMSLRLLEKLISLTLIFAAAFAAYVFLDSASDPAPDRPAHAVYYDEEGNAHKYKGGSCQ